MQVHLLVLEASPEALDEHVVDPAALPIHADGDAAALEHAGERQAGEGAALVRIEDLRPTVKLEGLVEGLHAEAAVRRVGKPPGEDPAAVGVHDRHQVREAGAHGDVRYVRHPHLIRAGDLHPTQQVGVDLVARPETRPRGPGLRVDRLDAHQPHQALHPLAVHHQAALRQLDDQLAAPQERQLQVDLVQGTHDLQRVGRQRPGLVVHRGARHLQELALPRDRQPGVTIDAGLALRRR